MSEKEYIERDAVLNELATHFNKVDGKTLYHPSMALAMHDVRKGPAADVAPVVHGRWIHDSNNLYGCSECLGRETMSPKKLKPYCPNCGCKMDGE